MRADLFRVEGLELQLRLWPPRDDFEPGRLSHLFGVLNADDDFSGCELAGTHAATFEGKMLLYNIEPTTLAISADVAAYGGFPIVVERICFLLDKTKEGLAEHMHYVIPGLSLWATWSLEPGSKAAEVGPILKTKTLKLKPEHLSFLGGEVHGAAVELAGSNADDSMDWLIKVAPFLSEPDHLYLSAKLAFRQPEEAPSDETAMVRDYLQEGYEFLSTNVKGFANSFMP